MPTFGYWPIRGCAQPVRLLLAYLKIEYTNKNYEKSEEWFEKDKKELGLDFPNLPYFIDGNVKITESAAIPVYIIRKHKRCELLGQNPDGTFNEKEAKVQEVLRVLDDVFWELTDLCYNPKFQEIKDKTLQEKLGPKLQKLNEFLNQNEYIVGSLTYADFVLYEVLNYFKNIFPDYLSPQLAAFILRFEKLPGIQEYTANPNVDLTVFCNPSKAAWIGPKKN